jgi:hypothetical protein
MRFGKFDFGAVEIDGVRYEYDVVIDRGKVRKRKKKPSQKFRNELGHTPLSMQEKIPWQCRHLLIGTGTHGSLQVMKDVRQEAKRKKIDLQTMPTAEAIKILASSPADTNAILHVTC